MGQLCFTHAPCFWLSLTAFAKTIIILLQAICRLKKPQYCWTPTVEFHTLWNFHVTLFAILTFPFKNEPFMWYLLSVQCANNKSTRTIVIVVSFVTGATVDVRSKFPCNVSHGIYCCFSFYMPMLMLWPFLPLVILFDQRFPYFTHHHSFVLIFYSSVHLLQSGLIITSLNFITFSSLVWSNPPPSPAPNAAISAVIVSLSLAYTIECSSFGVWYWVHLLCHQWHSFSSTVQGVSHHQS